MQANAGNTDSVGFATVVDTEEIVEAAIVSA